MAAIESEQSTSPTNSFSSSDDVKKDSKSNSSPTGVTVTSLSKEPDPLALAEPLPEQTQSRLLSDFFFRRSPPIADLDAIATPRSVYDDPNLAKYYWPRPDYENLHRFDPSATWTYREEKALVRKLDWRVMLWAAMMFSALNIDRGNLSQANSDNILGDLKLTTNDYNLGNTVFRLAFLCAEVPSQLISKRIGPDRWIPMQMCLWSIVTSAQFWLSGRKSFLTCRALIGLIQGGFIPDLILYLSYYYKKTELPNRLAAFWASSNVASIVSSFLAYGILHLRGYKGRAGWRWLFLIEGLITLTISIASFFNMPAAPTKSKTWFRPNGWFTEREEVILVSRVLRDDPTKGDMHNRQGITPKRLWKALLDYDLWPLYIIGLLFGIPSSPPATYLTLSLRNLGFSTFKTNLLTIPSTTFGIVTVFSISLLSEFVNDRSFISMAENAWILPFLVAIYHLPAHPNQWLYYGLASGLLSYPYVHPIQVAWCSRNAGGVASRSVNASLYNMFVQASSIIAANVYRTDDAPRYLRGNRVLIGVACMNLVLYPLTKLYYILRNRHRDRIWNALSPKEQAHYLETTKDVGNRRLDFRFAH